jgi:2-polyprenyl-3-methyl-5-hydroxy-6-metoxy-1,4-benzoquinol methylase
MKRIKSIEEYAEKHHQIYSNEIPSTLENILVKNKFDSILDAGCGDGSLIKALLDRGYSTELNITGVDLSESRIKLVKKMFPKATLYVGSVEDMTKVKSNTVDLLISTQVIEHVDDRKMIKSVARVCKKGGIVYLSTVYKKWYGWYFYRVNNKWLLDPTHLREYTIFSDLTNLFKKDFTLSQSNIKSLKYPIIDLLLNLIHYSNRNRTGLLWKLLRTFKIPVIGYYNWEIVLIKK